MNIFICYERSTLYEFAYPIKSALVDIGLKVWLDKFEIFNGNNIIDVIINGIQVSDYMIVIITSEFLDNDWCLYEVNKFIELKGLSKLIILLYDVNKEDLAKSDISSLSDLAEDLIHYEDNTIINLDYLIFRIISKMINESYLITRPIETSLLIPFKNYMSSSKNRTHHNRIVYSLLKNIVLVPKQYVLSDKLANLSNYYSIVIILRKKIDSINENHYIPNNIMIYHNIIKYYYDRCVLNAIISTNYINELPDNIVYSKIELLDHIHDLCLFSFEKILAWYVCID